VAVDRYVGFREFVSARSPALSRTAYLLTGDHQLAEDLLQSALLKTLTRWPRLHGDGNPEGYVRRVLYTEHVSWWRRRRRVTEQVTGWLPEQGGTDPAEHAALRLTLEQALARLTPRQRAVLVLRFYDDLTEAATAQVLHCSVGTVKSQTHHALGRLRALAPDLADTFARTETQP